MSRRTPERSFPVVITPTGWRLVGRAAQGLLLPPEPGDTPSFSPDDVLFAADFTVRSRRKGENPVETVLAALNEWLADGTATGGPLLPDNHLEEGSGRYDRIRWSTRRVGEGWWGELTRTHPHPMLRGTPCTTRALLSARGTALKLRVHVLASGGLRAVGGYVGVGQARPEFLKRLFRETELSFLGLRAEVRELTAAGIPTFVRNVLLNSSRDYPVAVMAPREETVPPAAPYLLDPEEISSEFLGIAHLWIIDEHATTFTLTDSVGDKRLSCFWGALRIYMPGFSKADSGFDHPLLVADRVTDEVQRAGVLGQVAWAIRHRIPLRSFVDEGQGETASAPGEPHGVPTQEPENVTRGPAVSSGLGLVPSADDRSPVSAIPEAGNLHVVEALLGNIAHQLADFTRLQEQLLDAVTQLRTATAVRIAHARALDRRLARVEALLSGAGPKPATAQQEPTPASSSAVPAPEDDIQISLASLLRNAATLFEEDLLILDSAIRSAEESPFEDLLEVSVVLKAMAEMARRRQSGRLGVPMREAFAELGIDYRGGISETTSNKLRRQFRALLPDGSEVDCYEHIALGNSYDPRHCLRIYFSSRVPREPRFVIAHVGRHLDVLSTT